MKGGGGVTFCLALISKMKINIQSLIECAVANKCRATGDVGELKITSEKMYQDRQFIYIYYINYFLCPSS